MHLSGLELWTARLIHEPAAGLKPDIARMACRLLQIRGTVACDAQTGNLQYYCPSRAADLAVPPAIAFPVQHQTQSPLATQITKADLASGRRKAPVLAPQPTPSATKAAVKKSVVQVALKVGIALRRSAPTRPTSSKALLQMIQAHIPATVAHMVTPQQVCAVLQAQQVVKMTKNAPLSYPHGGRAFQPQIASSCAGSSKKTASLFEARAACAATTNGYGVMPIQAE